MAVLFAEMNTARVVNQVPRLPLPYRRPWISPMERARCASSLGLPLTAMVEGIGDDPALVDSFLDPDAMTSALLPAIGSR